MDFDREIVDALPTIAGVRDRVRRTNS